MEKKNLNEYCVKCRKNQKNDRSSSQESNRLLLNAECDISGSLKSQIKEKWQAVKKMKFYRH